MSTDNVKLPKQIEKELAAAEEEVTQQAPGEEATPSETPENLQETPSDQTPEQVADAPVEHEEQQANTEEEAPAPAENWEHKYNVLKGKYDFEVPRLHREIREMKTSLAELTTQLEAAKAAAETSDSSGNDNSDLITRLREEYGEGYIDDIVSLLRAELEAKMPRQPEQDTAPAAPQTAPEPDTQDAGKLVDKLTELVPNWPSINRNDGFLDWLAKTDPLTGRVRQDMLNEASDAGDVSRVAAFFTSWEQTATPATPTPDLTPTPPAPEPTTTQPQHRTMPAESAAPEATAQPEGRVFTQAEVEKFYHDLTMGKYRGREQEAKSLDREIFLAGAEGRIQ